MILTTLAIQEIEDQHTSGLYTKRPLRLCAGRARACGMPTATNTSTAWAGRAANIGHGNPQVAQAIAEQAGHADLLPGDVLQRPRAALEAPVRAWRLSARVPVQLGHRGGGSGAQVCPRDHRAHRHHRHHARLPRAHHGRAFGHLGEEVPRAVRAAGARLYPRAYNNLEALQGAVNDDSTAAVILEVVQGEGGVTPGQAEYLRGRAALCQERGALLIIDEMQTGFGRTGRCLPSSTTNLQPDLVCLAKSMAGGLPMGAVLLGEKGSASCPRRCTAPPLAATRWPARRPGGPGLCSKANSLPERAPSWATGSSNS
jgi:LysW-gamma-L-lysine/LysW-L-ornithine aminotransferase